MTFKKIGDYVLKSDGMTFPEPELSDFEKEITKTAHSLLDCAMELCRADKSALLLTDLDSNIILKVGSDSRKNSIDSSEVKRWDVLEKTASKQVRYILTGKEALSLISGKNRGNDFAVLVFPFSSPEFFLGALYFEKTSADGEEVRQCVERAESIVSFFTLILRNSLLFYRSVAGSSELKRSYDDLRALFEISRNMISQLDIDTLLFTILTKACEVIGAERGSIFLVDNDGTELFDRVSIGSESLEEIRFSINKGIAGLSAREGRALIVDNASLHSEFNPDIDKLSGYETMNIMCVPLFDHNNLVFGVMELINKKEGKFTDYDLDYLSIFTTTTSKIIENAQLFKSNMENQKKIEALNDRLRRTVIDQSLEISRIKEMLNIKQTELEEKYKYHSLIGRSQKMQEIYLIIDKIKDTPFSALIQGNSGTGKELVAKAIHYNSNRRKKHFVAINCAALSRSLLESELFGHVKGAFTSADRDKKGLFEIAHGGTLFLDEISEMDIELQAKLLRVIEEKQIRKVGGVVNIPVDVRIISATNRKLLSRVKEGKFREDLFYRLNVIEINLPSLREKIEDIPLLVEHILGKIQKETGKKIDIDSRVIKCYQNYDWPGNVRELENEIKRAATLSDNVITLDFISPELRSDLTTGSGVPVNYEIEKGFCLDKAIDELELNIISQALEQADGNKARAAKLLGIPRTSLYNKLKKYNASIYGRSS